MKTSIKKSMFIAIYAMVSVFFIASCSTDKMDDVKPVSAERVMDDAVDLKQGNAAQNQLLAQVRRATAKYQRVEVAFADGYLEDNHCVYNEALGAGMGYHFLNPGLMGVDFDPLQPQVLLYEQSKNGKYNLIGVEYIVMDIGQDHPHFGNQPFDVGGTSIPDPHYSLHVWVWKANPLGMYFPFNSNVKCH